MLNLFGDQINASLTWPSKIAPFRLCRTGVDVCGVTMSLDDQVDGQPREPGALQREFDDRQVQCRDAYAHMIGVQLKIQARLAPHPP